ncbi:MAG: biotin--[acetyl-CoA-carboxylase] ligase [Chlamydiae bacterium]|nr:biotin--[acetyl-CoA-carboxylase] ligase [Chlamydiota bacterium]
MHCDINYLHFSCIHSTNTWALEHLAILDPQKITCITADEQTAGRGQFSKRWLSPPGVNLYATFCFYVPSPCAFLANLGQVLSISCCKALEEWNLSAQIKWPNDLLLQGKKVSGILCETAPIKDFLGIALGIGLNINMEPSLYRNLDQPITSLLEVTGKSHSIQEILQAIVKHFVEDFQLLSSQGFTPFLEYYCSHLAPLGETILLKQGQQTLQVPYSGIAETGALLVTLPCGTKREVYSRELLPQHYSQ